MSQTSYGSQADASIGALAKEITDGILRDRIVTAAGRHDTPVTPGVLADTNAMADLVVLRAGSAPEPTRAPAAARAGR